MRLSGGRTVCISQISHNEVRLTAAPLIDDTVGRKTDSQYLLRLVDEIQFNRAAFGPISPYFHCAVEWDPHPEILDWTEYMLLFLDECLLARRRTESRQNLVAACADAKLIRIRYV